MSTKPRSIFRCRRNRGLVLTDRPGAAYHELVSEAALKAGLDMKPGTFTQAVIWHDPDCRRPQGGECSCIPEVKLRPLEDPRRN